MNPLVAWNELFLKPRQSVQWALEKKPGQVFIIFIIFLFGVLHGATKINPGEQGVVEFVVSLVLYGGLMQLIVFNIVIWSVNGIALRFGGNGNFTKTQIGFTWSFCLYITFSFLLDAFSYVMTDVVYQQLQSADKKAFWLAFRWIYQTLSVAQIIWYLVFLIASVSESHNLSTGKSILSLILGFLISITPLMVISLIVEPEQWTRFIY